MKTFATTFKALIAAAGLVASASASANLLVNGGFEDNNVASGSWSYFNAGSVNGWEGSNIEVWDHLLGVTAPEGDQHAELNAHPYTGNAFSIYQSFATTVGQHYDVSFYYSARSNDHETFSFNVADLNAVLDEHIVGSWTHYFNSFVANDSTTTISFTTVAPYADTVGNFLDGVAVTRSVPAPTAFALLGLGLLGLGMARNKSRA